MPSRRPSRSGSCSPMSVGYTSSAFSTTRTKSMSPLQFTAEPGLGVTSPTLHCPGSYQFRRGQGRAASCTERNIDNARQLSSFQSMNFIREAISPLVGCKVKFCRAAPSSYRRCPGRLGPPSARQPRQATHPDVGRTVRHQVQFYGFPTTSWDPLTVDWGWRGFVGGKGVLSPTRQWPVKSGVRVFKRPVIDVTVILLKYILLSIGQVKKRF